MNAATATAQPPPDPRSDDLTREPPSLRRRAPARIDITLTSGKSLTVCRRRVHVRSGQLFVLKIVPQTCAIKVEIAVEPPLQTIVPVNQVGTALMPSYHAEVIGNSYSPLNPLPVTGKLHISLIDGLPEPCKIGIPITVWPTFKTLALWWVLAYLGIVALRWQKALADTSSIPDMGSAIWNELFLLGALLILGFLVAIPFLWFVGWVVSLADGAEPSE